MKVISDSLIYATHSKIYAQLDRKENTHMFSLSNFPEVTTSTANRCSTVQRTPLARQAGFACTLKVQLKISTRAWSCKQICAFSLYLPHPLGISSL